MNHSILEQIGGTPLVALRHIGKDLSVPILVKCEHLNPGGSIKDRLAKAIITEARASGQLKPGMTIIEATAGNTGIGLAMVAAAHGHKLVCVMPEKMSVDKQITLKYLGAKVIVAPNAPPSSPENFRNVAERLAKENGWFLADQFNNPANIRAHKQTTAEEILADCKGPIGAFVVGAGTGGTISGVGSRLKAADPTTQVILADPIGSSLAGWISTGNLGPDSHFKVEGIGSSAVPKNLDRSVIDSSISISDDDSFAMVKRLVQEEGLLVGGSAGTNVAAAVLIAQAGGLKGPVITILPDSWDRYRTQPWMQEMLG